VFIRAWRARTTLDPARGVVGGWLVGFTRRQIADRLAARAADPPIDRGAHRATAGHRETASAAGESDYDDDGRATVPHPNPDELALAALPAEAVEPDVAAHVAVCATCQAKVASLRHAVDIARADTTDPGPPPRVWHAIITELDDDLIHDLHDELDGRPSAPPRMPRTRRWRLLVPAAATAASLAAGLIFGLAASSPSLEPAPITLAQIPLTPVTTSDPATSGTVDILESDGVRKVVIEVTEPSRPAAAEYLEAWLMDTDGNRLYSLGALTREPDDTRLHGAFRLPPDLSLTAFNTVDVSAERFDGNPTHSGVSLLRGHTA
jgi:Anti-sigma-K factor rskA/Sigma-70 region 2